MAIAQIFICDSRHRKMSTEVSRRCIWLFSLLALINADTSPRPHIIVVVADDLGWDDISFHGSNQIPTPNIDTMAYNGIIMNNYYVQPICTPTRSALMTARHPIHTGMQQGVIVGSQPYGLPLNITIMPQYFKQLGYTTRMVGKWHLGFFDQAYLPTVRGFDSHFGYWLGCEDYFDHTAEADWNYWGFDFHRDLEPALNYTNQYSTDLYSSEVVRIIHEHNKSTPLFLYMAHQAVHSANFDSAHLQAPEKYIKRHMNIQNIKRRTFAGMVSALDDAMGALYKALSDSGMLNNSVIVFTTDNGGPSNGFDLNAASNWPLRGVKATLWEGGVRGVGFIHSPLLQKSGYTCENLVHVCDWLPTLYSAAGGNVSSLPPNDGIDLWKMLSTQGPPQRKEVLHNLDPRGHNGGIRVGDYKLVFGDISFGTWDGWYPPWQSKNDDKLAYDEIETKISGNFTRLASILSPIVVECGKKPANASTNCKSTVSPCLYHIPSDPCEYNNIADSYPLIMTQLLERIKYYNSTMVPPANKPVDPKGNPHLHDGFWVPWL